MLGWGIIGIGKIADIAFAPAICRQKDSRLSAVYSRSLARATVFAEKHGAAASYDQVEALLGDHNVDVVYIASPNALHKEHAVAALLAGKHVLIEKPMTLTVQDALEVVAVEKQTGMRAAVGFHLRHKATNRAAREAAADGRLGELRLFDGGIGAGKDVFPYDTWRSNAQTAGGGTLLNQGTHVLDLVRYITAREVTDVAALVDRTPMEDVASILGRADGGLILSLSSHQVQGGASAGWMLVGSEGWLMNSGGTSPRPGDELVLQRGDHREVLVRTETSAYDAEVEALVSAVLHGADVIGTTTDGLRNAELASAIYRSTADRAVVSPFAAQETDGEVAPVGAGT